MGYGVYFKFLCKCDSKHVMLCYITPFVRKTKNCYIFDLIAHCNYFYLQLGNYNRELS